MDMHDVEEFAQEHVTRGASVLGSVNPEWKSHVNVETLDLVSATQCVLGQVVHSDGEHRDAYDAAIIAASGDPYLMDDWTRGPLRPEGGSSPAPYASNCGFDAEAVYDELSDLADERTQYAEFNKSDVVKLYTDLWKIELTR